jgi:hypothetical protein
MVVKYKASDGARLNDSQAARYGSRITHLKEKKGFVTPEIVINDAKNPKSPLHDYFDWNDREAAESWRIEQAKYLIRHIVVTIINDDKPETIRQFYSITPTTDMHTDSPKVYVTLDDVLSNVDTRKEVIAYALRELEGWKARYKQYSELSGLIEILEDEIRKVKGV